MFTSLSMTICLFAISAQPPQPGAPAAEGAARNALPLTQPSTNQALGTFSPYAPTADHCDECARRHHKHTPFHDWACPPCNLAQRYPYYPTDHGHYYLRPYHMQRVLEQQALATSWGEDPRNPYGQLVFERVYDQLRAEQAAKSEPLPIPGVKPMTNGTKPMSQNSVTPKPLPPKPEAEPNMIPLQPLQPAPKGAGAQQNDQGRRSIITLR